MVKLDDLQRNLNTKKKTPDKETKFQPQLVTASTPWKIGW